MIAVPKSGVPVPRGRTVIIAETRCGESCSGESGSCNGSVPYP